MRKLTLAVVLSTAFATTAMANEMPETGLIDAQQVFHMEDAQPMQLAVLSEQEMRETEGAVWWFAPIVGWTVGGGITGVAINRWQTGSWEGSGRAFGAGATAGFYNSNLAVRALTPVGAFVAGGFGAASWYR